MQTPPTALPVREVAAQLDRACREVGFIQIVGHSIPRSATKGLADALDEFFALPLTVKNNYRRPSSENRGYSPPKSESLSMSLGVAAANQMNDFYEAIVVGTEVSDYPGVDLPESSYAANTWPVAAPGFRPAIEEYFRHAQGLARILMCAFTDALGLQPGYFDSMLDHSIDAMKMNNYALPEGEIRISGDMTGMGAHTDFGILTILWADQVPGLQVLSADGVWHDVQPADGALLINLGDAMGTLDERPMALDSAPSRPTYRRWSDHPTSLCRILFRRELRRRHRSTARDSHTGRSGIPADHDRREHRGQSGRD